MDRSTKILIIGVIAIACLFVGVMVWGVAKHRNEPDPDPKKIELPDWVRSGLAGLFASRGPKVELGQKKFVLNPGTKLAIVVPSVPEKGPQFRTGKFRLTAGKQATIIYTDSTPDKPKGLSDTQTVVFPADDSEPARKKNDPNEGSITAMRAGGSLTIQCGPSVQCVLELE
jgi:hypothetical protein